MGQKINLIKPIVESTNQSAVYTDIKNAEADGSYENLGNSSKALYVEGTLAGELQRIKAYIAEIGREAAFLALKASGDTTVNETSTLELIAEAMLSIVKNTAADASNAATFQKDSSKQELILDAGSQTVLPPGYYTNSVTVTATSLSNQSQGTAVALDILKGETAWVNGVEVTGTLDTNLSDKKAGNSAYKENNDKLVIYLNEDAENNDNNRIVNTGIKYVTAGEVTNKVTIKKVTDPDSETTSTVGESVQIPAGYYPNAINIPVYVEDATGNEEKILNANVVKITGNITDFDNEGKSTITPGSKTLDYFTNVIVDKAEVSKNTTTGGYTVTSAGWINTTDTLSGLNEGSYNTEASVAIAEKTIVGEGTKNVVNITTTKKVHGYTPDNVTVELDLKQNPENQTSVPVKISTNNGKAYAGFETTVSIVEGYHPSGDITVRSLGIPIVTPSISSSTKATAEASSKPISTISSQYITNGFLQNGYALSDYTYYKVLDAGALSITSNKNKLTVTTAASGWLDKEGAREITLTENQIDDLVASLTTVDTLAYGSNNTATGVIIANAANATVQAASGNFYNKVDMSVLLTEMQGI